MCISHPLSLFTSYWVDGPLVNRRISNVDPDSHSCCVQWGAETLATWRLFLQSGETCKRGNARPCAPLTFGSVHDLYLMASLNLLTGVSTLRPPPLAVIDKRPGVTLRSGVGRN